MYLRNDFRWTDSRQYTWAMCQYLLQCVLITHRILVTLWLIGQSAECFFATEEDSALLQFCTDQEQWSVKGEALDQ